MSTYIVASYSPFHHYLNLRTIEADSSTDARLQAAKEDGWEISAEDLDNESIEDLYTAMIWSKG